MAQHVYIIHCRFRNVEDLHKNTVRIKKCLMYTQEDSNNMAGTENRRTI